MSEKDRSWWRAKRCCFDFFYRVKKHLYVASSLRRAVLKKRRKINRLLRFSWLFTQMYTFMYEYECMNNFPQLHANTGIHAWHSPKPGRVALELTADPDSFSITYLLANNVELVKLEHRGCVRRDEPTRGHLQERTKLCHKRGSESLRGCSAP